MSDSSGCRMSDSGCGWVGAGGAVQRPDQLGRPPRDVRSQLGRRHLRRPRHRRARRRRRAADVHALPRARAAGGFGAPGCALPGLRARGVHTTGVLRMCETALPSLPPSMAACGRCLVASPALAVLPAAELIASWLRRLRRCAGCAAADRGRRGVVTPRPGAGSKAARRLPRGRRHHHHPLRALTEPTALSAKALINKSTSLRALHQTSDHSLAIAVPSCGS